MSATPPTWSALEAWARSCDAKDLPELLGLLEAARAIAGARLQAAEISAARPRAVDSGAGDQWITIAEAAARLGVHPKWLYRHRGTLPFVRAFTREGGPIRISERELRMWMERPRT